jgi:hypothetical protein
MDAWQMRHKKVAKIWSFWILEDAENGKQNQEMVNNKSTPPPKKTKNGDACTPHRLSLEMDKE